LRTPSPALALLALFGGAPSMVIASDSTTQQFWPEIDAYVRIDERSRLLLTAAATRAMEGLFAEKRPVFQDAQFTLNFDYTLAPFLREHVPQAEWVKSRLLWTRLGLEYGRSFDSADDAFRSYTGVAELHARFPTESSLVAATRLRLDLRDINGERSQRYRVRVGAEWQDQVFDHPIEPYGSIEFLYDTRYDKWSRVTLKTGLETPITERWRLEPYVELQLNRPQDELKRVLGIGLTFKVYFD